MCARPPPRRFAARAFPLPFKPGTIVSGFMPLKSEINPMPLMRKLAEAGASRCRPSPGAASR